MKYVRPLYREMYKSAMGKSLVSADHQEDMATWPSSM